MFHYHKSDSYAPEFVSAVGPNVKAPRSSGSAENTVPSRQAWMTWCS